MIVRILKTPLPDINRNGFGINDMLSIGVTIKIIVHPFAQAPFRKEMSGLPKKVGSPPPIPYALWACAFLKPVGIRAF